MTDDEDEGQRRCPKCGTTPLAKYQRVCDGCKEAKATEAEELFKERVAACTDPDSEDPETKAITHEMRWVETQQTWWHYSESTGIWSRQEVEGARNKVHDVLGTVKPRVIQDILYILKAPLAIRRQDFDPDPWLVCVANGVLDLRNGRLGPHDSDLMMTKRIKVNYTPDHPGIKRWETILRPLLGEADGSSSERLDYLRRAVGYTLSGQGTEKAIFVVHGPTNSGKSTLAAGLSTAFGDYYVGVDPSLFATGTGSEAISRYSAAELDRARMAAAMELARGSRFKPSLKALVGDKDFPARAPGEKTITVRLGCVPWFFTNYVPRGMGDKAIYSRLHPIPFPNTLLDPDPDVIKWVQSDEGAAAVLSWAVKGCLEWRQQGLGKPGGLELEGDELEREDDTFGRFLRDECVSADARKPGARTKASEVLGRYQLWCQDEGEKAMTGTAFGITMREQGMGSFRGDKNVAYYPVEMRPADPHTFLASRGRVNRTS